MDLVTKCEMCDITDKLLICSRCHIVYYCGKPHQKAHWKEHKLVCRVSVSSGNSSDTKSKITTVSGHGDRLTSTGSSPQSSFSSMNSTSTSSCKTDTSNSSKSGSSFGQLSKLTGSGESAGIISSHIGKFTLDGNPVGLPEDPGTDDGIVKGNNQENKLDTDPRRGSATSTTPTFFLPEAELECSTHNSASGYDHNKSTFLQGAKQLETCKLSVYMQEDSDSEKASTHEKSTFMTISDDKMDQQIRYAAGCLERYGCCVIDDLCGESFCSRVLEDVQSLHDSGIFQDGQVTGPNANIHPSATKRARQDIITWVTGDEECYQSIGMWMKHVDRFVRELSTYFSYRIDKRSKAMVACYPGSENSGRSYVKHVDNPNGDGRVITCLYYLNKDWNSSVNGGVLRLFPKGHSKVATVDPKFDRLVLFWSDDRNPHEVMPAFATRYAITLWYMDTDELEAGGRLNTDEANRFSYVTLK